MVVHHDRSQERPSSPTELKTCACMVTDRERPYVTSAADFLSISVPSGRHVARVSMRAWHTAAQDQHDKRLLPVTVAAPSPVFYP